MNIYMETFSVPISKLYSQGGVLLLESYQTIQPPDLTRWSMWSEHFSSLQRHWLHIFKCHKHIWIGILLHLAFVPFFLSSLFTIQVGSVSCPLLYQDIAFTVFTGQSISRQAGRHASQHCDSPQRKCLWFFKIWFTQHLHGLCMFERL